MAHDGIIHKKPNQIIEFDKIYWLFHLITAMYHQQLKTKQLGRNKIFISFQRFLLANTALEVKKAMRKKGSTSIRVQIAYLFILVSQVPAETIANKLALNKHSITLQLCQLTILVENSFLFFFIFSILKFCQHTKRIFDILLDYSQERNSFSSVN